MGHSFSYPPLLKVVIFETLTPLLHIHWVAVEDSVEWLVVLPGCACVY